MSNHSTNEIRTRVGSLLSRQRNYRREVAELTERYRYVVFYGCGVFLGGIIEKWNRYIGRKIDYCCDRDSAKWGRCFFGAKCISPDDLIAIRDNCVVFITVGDFKPVYRFLTDNGLPSVNLLYKYDLLASEVLAHYEQKQVIDRLCETYGMLEDRQSQRVFDAILTRVLGDGSNIDVMLDVCDKDQYFPPDIIKLSEHEHLIDIGAFNGDTIRDFVRRTQGKFDSIVSFEVDAENFRALQENVRKMPEQDRIEIFNLGIWDSDCDITYSIAELGSAIGAGDGKAHAVRLDDALKDGKASFIKMDIEGAEPQALHGARGLIQAQEPKLAICIYHDFRHLWEIPLYIKSLVPSYKIFLRHHNNMEYETVCYAIR